MTTKDKWKQDLIEEALNHIGEAVKCMAIVCNIESVEYTTPNVKWTKSGCKLAKSGSEFDTKKHIRKV